MDEIVGREARKSDGVYAYTVNTSLLRDSSVDEERRIHAGPGSEFHAEGLVGRDSRPGTSFIFYPVESKRGDVCVCVFVYMCVCVGEKNREERREKAGGREKEISLTPLFIP